MATFTSVADIEGYHRGADLPKITLMYVSTNTSNLNVRATPSMSGRVMGTLKKGTTVYAYDSSMTPDGWRAINYTIGDSMTFGFVSSQYLSTSRTSADTSGSSTSRTTDNSLVISDGNASQSNTRKILKYVGIGVLALVGIFGISKLVKGASSDGRARPSSAKRTDGKRKRPSARVKARVIKLS